MITGRELRKIRRSVARPKYPLDNDLIATAADADSQGGSIYATIQNPATHLIYRYLSEFVVEVLKNQNNKSIKEIRILDWGVGKGFVEYFLDKKGAQVEGYETNEFTHKSIWDKYNLKVKTSSNTDLPYKDETFDAVVGFGVLEHVTYDYEALKQINRVLKNDGLFFCFNLPNKYGYMHKVAWWRGVRYHDRLYSRKEVKNLLKRAGLNVVGRVWYRQLLPKNFISYPMPRKIESLDLFFTSYTPFCIFATSIEFVARKQYTYLSIH